MAPAEERLFFKPFPVATYGLAPTSEEGDGAEQDTLGATTGGPRVVAQLRLFRGHV